MINFFRLQAFRVISVGFAVIALSTVTGCQTPSALNAEDTTPPPQILHAGDEIRVSFPGLNNPGLETTQMIRQDGKINLPLGGEIVAAEKSPLDLEKEIAQLIGAQLQSREVRVTVLQSAFAVSVTGAVMNPGKITPKHALTALAAIAEAGGFDTAKANTRDVVVIRQLPDGQTKIFHLDIQAVLDGKSTQLFYLRHNDMVMVKEKFVWF